MDLYVLWSLLFCLINVSFIHCAVNNKKFMNNDSIQFFFLIYVIVFVEFHWFALIEYQQF